MANFQTPNRCKLLTPVDQIYIQEYNSTLKWAISPIGCRDKLVLILSFHAIATMLKPVWALKTQQLEDFRVSKKVNGTQRTSRLSYESRWEVRWEASTISFFRRKPCARLSEVLFSASYDEYRGSHVWDILEVKIFRCMQSLVRSLMVGWWVLCLLSLSNSD